MTLHTYFKAAKILGRISNNIQELKDERARNKIHTAVNDLADLLEDAVLNDLKERNKIERENDSRKPSTLGKLHR